MVNDVGDV